jgi:hypothetical protein
MQRATSLPTRILPVLAFAIFSFASVASAHAQATPTPDQLQTIQKCKDATAKLNALIASSISDKAAGSSSIDQAKALTADPLAPASQTFPALGKLADERRELDIGQDAPVLGAVAIGAIELLFGDLQRAKLRRVRQATKQFLA